MFKIDGNIDVEIAEAYVADSKFQPKQGETNGFGELVATYYDVVLLLKDKEGNTDTWHGEISNRTGTGTKAHEYRSDLTIQTMQEIGFGVNGLPDLEAQFVPAADRTITIPNLVGIKCSANVAKSDKTDRNGNPFYNVKYLNALGGGAKKLTMEEFMARRGYTHTAQASTAANQQYVQTPAAAEPAPQQYQQPPVQQYAQAPQQYAQQPQAAPQYAQPAPAPAPAAAPRNPYA